VCSSVPGQTVHNGTVAVDDTNSGSGAPWTFSDSGSQSYDVSYSTAGDFTNTATLHQEPGYGGDIAAQATVHVNVYKLQVSKTASTSFTRTWSWTVQKSADQSALTLAQGESFPVNYTVHVSAASAASADSAWTVHGQITLTNPAPMDATVSVADIMPGGVGVTLTDDQDNPLPTSVTVPANDQLVVNYPVGRAAQR
jgi:hypothetical protein